MCARMCEYMNACVCDRARANVCVCVCRYVRTYTYVRAQRRIGTNMLLCITLYVGHTYYGVRVRYTHVCACVYVHTWAGVLERACVRTPDHNYMPSGICQRCVLAITYVFHRSGSRSCPGTCSVAPEALSSPAW